MNIDLEKFIKSLKESGLGPGEIGLAINALVEAEIEKTPLEKLGYRPICLTPSPLEVPALLQHIAIPQEHPVTRFERKAKEALSSKRRIPGSGCACEKKEGSDGDK